MTVVLLEILPGVHETLGQILSSLETIYGGTPQKFQHSREGVRREHISKGQGQVIFSLENLRSGKWEILHLCAPPLGHCPKYKHHWKNKLKLRSCFPCSQRKYTINNNQTIIIKFQVSICVEAECLKELNAYEKMSSGALWGTGTKPHTGTNLHAFLCLMVKIWMLENGQKRPEGLPAGQ